jgi:hypothetical protein
MTLSKVRLRTDMANRILRILEICFAFLFFSFLYLCAAWACTRRRVLFRAQENWENEFKIERRKGAPISNSSVKERNILGAMCTCVGPHTWPFRSCTADLFWVSPFAASANGKSHLKRRKVLGLPAASESILPFGSLLNNWKVPT